MIYPPPQPTIEYRVTTADNRIMIWSACDRDHLERSLQDRGYKAAFVQENREYEQEIEAREAQEILVFELERAVEVA